MPEKSREFRKLVYFCCIDFENTFDLVQQFKLISSLKQIGLDHPDVILLKNLYSKQPGTVQMNQEFESDPVSIKRRVRQRCIVSPDLFNVSSEIIFNNVLQFQIEGVKVGTEIVKQHPTC